MGPIRDFDRSMGCDIDTRASNPEVWSLATDQLFFFQSTAPLWFRSLALNAPDFWMVWVDRWQAMRRGPLGDAAEFVAGTLPGDANSHFRIERIDRLGAGNGCRITWHPTPGRTNTVKWTDDLGTPFAPIVRGVAGGSFIDRLHPAAKAGFYRVKVELE